MEEDSRFLPVDPVTPRPHTPRSPYTPLGRTPRSPSQSYDYSQYSQTQSQFLSPVQYKSQEDIILENYIEKEYKKIIGCTVPKKQNRGWRRFVGLPLVVLSATCTAAGHVLVSVLNRSDNNGGGGGRGYHYDGHDSEHQGFDLQNIMLWCFGTILVLTVPVLLFCICLRRESPSFRALCPCDCASLCSWTDRTPQCVNWILLLLAGFLCWGAVTLRSSSVHYLSTYETAALFYSEPLVIIILAHFFVTDEKCGLISIMAAVLTLAGAVTFAWSYISAREEWHTNLAFGIGLVVGSVLSHSVLTTILRVIRTVHFSVVLAWLGLCGLTCTLISFTMCGHLAAPSDYELRDLLILPGIGMCAFGGLLFFVLALKYEEAAVVSIVLSLEIVLLHLGEYFLQDDAVGFDVFRIIGEAILLACIVIVAVRKYVRTRKLPHESASRDHSHCCSFLRI